MSLKTPFVSVMAFTAEPPEEMAPNPFSKCESCSIQLAKIRMSDVERGKVLAVVSNLSQTLVEVI